MFHAKLGNCDYHLLEYIGTSEQEYVRLFIGLFCWNDSIFIFI